ncbi:SIR2 family NAD-dependent protein deacylase [Nonomuraea rhizosphaerae]|uniref:SIR2 family NAD-dependent protein deacylase n=1 Tax=Nonomuraea rhizosphaerae TaxID=2665663 RepID=UPI001C601B2A|nr:Sir2 family NAD-dependent protein deacetylase [Nonomuraea rhizosphaerae]
MPVTVLTGAGISTDSGIPDFRGPRGVWTRDPAAQALFTLDNYLADPDVRRRSWRARRDHAAWDAEPNAAHLALVELERSGLLRAIVTQNVDELHQRAGSSPEKVIELHGTMFRVECLTCDGITPMREALDRLAAGEDDPPCARCGGLQKAGTISFGQALRPEVLGAALDAARSCEVFLAVGSSLTVQPAASLCAEALDAGARLVIVNAQPTPYDPYADQVIDDPIGQALPTLVKEFIDAAR